MVSDVCMAHVSILYSLLQYGVTYRQEHAHEEGIWSVSWVKNASRDVDYLVTGAADNMVKAWTWYVISYTVCVLCLGSSLHWSEFSEKLTLYLQVLMQCAK